MCGISVILPGSAVQTPPFAIDRMTAALAHRGPDGSECVRLPGCHLGHRRLAILDPAGGAQPMSDPTGRFWIVFNGEIYNHPELRRELEARGHAFRTRSDTEVLLAACMEFGERVVDRIQGQFAFALWDALEQTLFAARDRFGEKPLYWARSTAGHLLLASEIKAILASELIDPQIDPVSVDAYLGLFYVPPDRTIYSNVQTLAPAHAAVWDGDSFRSWRYWQPRLSVSTTDEDEAAQRVRTLLSRAIERQMLADVPVGAFLSGGLDSSTIVALMSVLQPEPVRTFSVGFGNLINELPFAREVATAYSTQHHELQMEIDVASCLDEMMGVYDEPFGDSSNIPTYLVSSHARQHVKVVLSGDGGDEIFGGYDHYLPFLAACGFAKQPAQSLTELSHPSLNASDRATLWTPDPQPRAFDHLRARYTNDSAFAGIDRALFFDLECYLPGDILVKVDRAAMAHGLETRAPFLDVELVEFVLGLRQQLRFGNGRLKHLLRTACETLWPPSVRARGKQGFGARSAPGSRNPKFNRSGITRAALMDLCAHSCPVCRTQRPRCARSVSGHYSVWPAGWKREHHASQPCRKRFDVRLQR